MANLKIKQGMTMEFKQLMNPAYELLESCETEVKKCTLLKDLDFAGDTIDALLEAIPPIKESLDALVESVKGTEIESFKLDEEASNMLKELWAEEEEEEKKPSRTGSSSSHGGGNNDTTPEPETPTLPPLNGNGYQFSLDPQEAAQRGDIFSGDAYSLTYFTNYILDKYGIKDENAANIIYMAVLEYGKEYFGLYNSNPLTTLPEADIWKAIYQRVSDMTRDEENNDLWKDFNVTL